MRHLLFVTGLSMAVGCGPAARSTETAPSAPATPASAARPFENPGGMWMPRQLVSHADTLRRLGLELDPAALSDPLAPPLGAVVSLGGCTASFVSPDGLIATNHHCVQSALQYNATPEANLVEDGYLARTPADEKWNGPAARVYVTQAFTDVTDQILGGLDAVRDDRERFDEIESRKKALIATCEKGRPELRCSVDSFFRGAEHYLIQQLQIRDVRLVYAPPRSVGAFGGDIDNWMWPRQAGDFAFYRAYVGKDGKPADHAADNAPYRPAHYLKLATKPLEKGDLVLVAGYPARTYRHRTAEEVVFAIEQWYPERIAFFDEYIAALRALSTQGEDVAIKAHTWIARFENSVKNNRGTLENLQRGGLVQRKQEREAALRAWIAADAARGSKYGDVFDRMSALHAEELRTYQHDTDFSRLNQPELLTAARMIVRMAEERGKPDAERDPEYQERNWPRLEASLRSMSRRYDRRLDQTLLTLGMRGAARHADANRAWLALVAGTDRFDDATIETTIDGAVKRLYAATKLEDEAVRVKLFTSATTDSLRKSRDSMILMALALRPTDREIEERRKRIEGARAAVEPRYMEALRAHAGGEVAPDANGTLRVTYGTVRGYQPRPDAPVYEPFTTLSSMVAKHTGQQPFDAPERVLEAARARRFGSYVERALGEVPVDFLSDVDITGGNSGSATLNARGEIVGLLFDNNYEGMSSDWQFMSERTRGIHVDIRYALWMLDVVEHADALVRELGATPGAGEPGT
ncbi:MAG TPA: S46 family peptidase, partial [Haliangium sp.]|nr:S46 family peptidase [Haliangium sp.]